MEIWNAYDKNFQLIEGAKLVRGETIHDGLCHLVCDIIVWHQNGHTFLCKEMSVNISAECGKHQQAARQYTGNPLSNVLCRKSLRLL